MTAKILSFPEGKVLPKLTKEQKTPIDEKIAEAQTKKYANAVVDDLVIGILTQLQHEGLNIGMRDEKKGNKTFLDLGIFMEAFKGLLYRELDLEHPFHYVTDNMMFRQKDKKTGRTYSVIDYQGKEIVDREEGENVVEFEGVDLNNDTDRLQPDSDK
tara:strand:+ start:2025 stop:2495 length:471 start_codon:yes stop_codon:yes gene_type:complete